jgi:hypothetical protein
MVCSPREIASGAAKALMAAVLVVAAGQHQVRVVLRGPVEQLRDQLRRMLQVGVHHAHPGRARRTQTLRDCATQPADPLFRPSMDQHNWQLGARADCLNRLGRLIGAVIDEDDFCRDAGEECCTRRTSSSMLPTSFG